MRTKQNLSKILLPLNAVLANQIENKLEVHLAPDDKADKIICNQEDAAKAPSKVRSKNKSKVQLKVASSNVQSKVKSKVQLKIQSQLDRLNKTDSKVNKGKSKDDSKAHSEDLHLNEVATKKQKTSEINLEVS